MVLIKATITRSKGRSSKIAHLDEKCASFKQLTTAEVYETMVETSFLPKNMKLWQNKNI